MNELKKRCIELCQENFMEGFKNKRLENKTLSVGILLKVSYKFNVTFLER